MKFEEGIIVKKGPSDAPFSHHKNYGRGSRQCRACHTHNGLILKWGMNLCRRCFREYAEDMGFKRYN